MTRCPRQQRRRAELKPRPDGTSGVLPPDRAGSFHLPSFAIDFARTARRWWQPVNHRPRCRNHPRRRRYRRVSAPGSAKVAPTASLATEKKPLAKAAESRAALFPLTIFATYRTSGSRALIDPSGVIHVGGESFTSPSMAASAARRQHGYTGAGKAATNGWTWWRFIDEHGATVLLDELRKAPDA